MANGTGEKRKTCFVVMGFGEKTDFQSNPQRVLDLNRTFEDIIEPATTAAGLECIRADKIIHSTVIDKPMYEHLLEADVVIADISTSNANALYELGVRHALRPHATIVMAEEKFAFPFDLNHVAIEKYVHMGKEIGFREVIRMQERLKTKITAILARQETDSPVFLFLPKLLGPAAAALPPAPTAAPQDDKSLAELMDAFQAAKTRVTKPADWRAVLEILERLRKLQPNDAFILQQFAVATYKSEHPGRISSLMAARDALAGLQPDTCSDAETIGIWGAIHKRLWTATTERAYLDKAIRSYARGYFFKDDYYNGINFAFLLNVRASVSTGDEALADRVLARRIRTEILTVCDARLAANEQADPAARLGADDVFWIRATKVEALHALGRTDESDLLRQALIAEVGKDDWKIDSMETQLALYTELTL